MQNYVVHVIKKVLKYFNENKKNSLCVNKYCFFLYMYYNIKPPDLSIVMYN